MITHEFRLLPKKGAHPLLLGMSRSEVESALGIAGRSMPSRIEGEDVLFFESIFARLSLRSDVVVEISLAPPARVLFETISLFDAPEKWRDVAAVDGDPLETLGFVVLRNLGLMMTGFHDHDQGQLAITVFENGRLDALEAQIRPVA